MKRRNRNVRTQEQRRVEAATRQAEHSLLTPEQRLAKLDARLGKDVGAVKERAKIKSMIEAKFKPAPKKVVEQVYAVEVGGGKKSGKKGHSPKA